MSNWRTAAYQYMVENIEDHRDRLTGEVNTSSLADAFIWDDDALSVINDDETVNEYGAVLIDEDWVGVEELVPEIAFAVVEVDTGRMTVAESKDWVRKYTGED